MANIADLYASIPGLKADYVALTGTVKADYKNDWDDVPGGAAGAAPVNSVAPVVSGTPYVGQTLSVTNGTWTGNPTPTYTYVWKRNGTPIALATASTYLLVTADLGATITCTVTATNTEGAASATSNSPPAIIAVPVNTVAPVASGTATVGQTLSVTNGTWTGGGSIAYTYVWERNGSPIALATASTYLLDVADLGATITATVTATNAAGASSPAVSNGLGPVA